MMATAGPTNTNGWKRCGQFAGELFHEPVRDNKEERHAAHAPEDGNQDDHKLRRIAVPQEDEYPAKVQEM
ncbi:MAG: hypothetical protein M0C28_34345 [Candidatus Moduliflexus flocculans]|nr:hypothetical protein [Candidatus Moduliflexus flocculans]